MRRREAIRRLVVMATMAGWAGGVNAQRSTRAPRIAFLSDREVPEQFREAFLQGLAQSGYVEGRNIAVETRVGSEFADWPATLAAYVAEQRYDVIIAADAVIVTLARITTTVPIVMPLLGDPVSAGYAASLARPGGNVTGLTVLTPELSRKRLEVFGEALPGLKRVGMLFNGANAGAPRQVLASGEAAKVLGIEVTPLDVRFPDGVEAAFTEAVRQRLQGVIILSDSRTITFRARLGAASLAQRVPTMFANKLYLTGGGLMSYGPDILGMMRRAAWYVDRILKGARAGDLPIEQPTRFELAINLPTAQALGIVLPQSMLARADEVIR